MLKLEALLADTGVKNPVLKANSELNVNWCWVKGHAGNKYNEICDSLAVEESRKASL